jgi:hypothetical protein
VRRGDAVTVLAVAGSLARVLFVALDRGDDDLLLAAAVIFAARGPRAAPLVVFAIVCDRRACPRATLLPFTALRVVATLRAEVVEAHALVRVALALVVVVARRVAGTAARTEKEAGAPEKEHDEEREPRGNPESSAGACARSLHDWFVR